MYNALQHTTKTYHEGMFKSRIGCSEHHVASTLHPRLEHGKYTCIILSDLLRHGGDSGDLDAKDIFDISCKLYLRQEMSIANLKN